MCIVRWPTRIYHGHARDVLERDALHQLLCSLAAHGDNNIAQRFGDEPSLAIGEIILNIFAVSLLALLEGAVYAGSCGNRHHQPPISFGTLRIPPRSCRGAVSGELAELSPQSWRGKLPSTTSAFSYSDHRYFPPSPRSMSPAMQC